MKPSPQPSGDLPAQRRLSDYRGEQTRRPLPAAEKVLLAVLIPHLCFLPWALGTMRPWSQLTSLGLAVLTFGLALALPDDSRRSGGRSPLKRLLRFPLFWLGVALLGYLVVQGCNPFYRFQQNPQVWWVVPVPNISWLPTSIDAPFERSNVWRQAVIYAAAWLTLCTIWIGFTRRRSFEIILTALALNGLPLVILALFVRFTRDPELLLWFDERRVGAITFGPIIYKNHAGAYLALLAAACVALAARHRERGQRIFARSTPALLWILGAVGFFFAEIFTYSRGGTVLLAGFFGAAGLAFAFHRVVYRSGSTTPRVLTFTMAGLVALVVAFAAAQVDYSKVAQRFEILVDPTHKDGSLAHRADATAAGLDMLAMHWPRGVGAGCFRHAFPTYIQKYPNSYRGGQLFWSYVHNDWLQLPIELGAGGVVLFALGACWWLYRLVRGAVWRSLPALLLVLGAGQTLMHASFDFVFQNPAIIITWLVLMVTALRWAEARSRSG